MKGYKLMIKAFGTPSDLHTFQIDEMYVDRGGVRLDLSDYEKFDSHRRCGRVTHFSWKGTCLSVSTPLSWNAEPERFLNGASMRHPNLNLQIYIRTPSEELMFHLKEGALLGEIIDFKRGDRRSDFIQIIRKKNESEAIGFKRKDGQSNQ